VFHFHTTYLQYYILLQCLLPFLYNIFTFRHISLPKFRTLLSSYCNKIFNLFKYILCTQLPSVTLAFIRI
jgi:hypothetical protein